MKRFRIVVAVVAVALVALAVYLLGFRGSSVDPASLLATNPALPRTWTDTRRGNATTRIRWREDPGGATTDPSGCAAGRGAIFGWSDGGTWIASPDAYEMVCVYRSRFVAWMVYKWQSFYRVGGEDWPNFEPSSDARTAPSEGASFMALHADEWEVGCGLGDADTLCGVWVFRARYDEVLVVMELRTITAGIAFEAMRRFVESVDRVLAAEVRSR